MKSILFLILIVVAIADDQKKGYEYFDYGFSLYTINYTAYSISTGAQVIYTGIGVSDVGALPAQLYLRFYGYPYILFPREIYRNMNGDHENIVDNYLIYEYIYPYP